MEEKQHVAVEVSDMKRAKRDSPIFVRGTKAERDSINKRAAALGVSASEYMLGCEAAYNRARRTPHDCDVSVDSLDNVCVELAGGGFHIKVFVSDAEIWGYQRGEPAPVSRDMAEHALAVRRDVEAGLLRPKLVE